MVSRTTRQLQRARFLAGSWEIAGLCRHRAIALHSLETRTPPTRQQSHRSVSQALQFSEKKVHRHGWAGGWWAAWTWVQAAERRARGDLDKQKEASASVCRGEGGWRAGAHSAWVPPNQEHHSKSLGRGARQGSVPMGAPTSGLQTRCGPASLTVLTFWMLPNNPERELLPLPVCRGRI